MNLRSTFFLLAIVGMAAAADWPTHRADAARSGYTAETIPNQLRLRWKFHTGQAPKPAWPTSDRIDFDLAFQPIIVGNLVIFGSSADDQVYAIDAITGATRWRFFSEGPIRFAPTAWKDRVFVASDDGYLYALSLEDGSVLWKYRGGPEDKHVFGNERMISKWPGRGGPVVMDDVVYFSAGIWPSDGVYLHALDAATGKAVWSNNETGRMLMKQPHGGAEALSGVAPQGYLVASKDALVVPTGRAVPAVFGRADGALRYYHLQKNQQRGGTRVVLSDAFFLNAGCFFDQATGELATQLGMGSAVAIPGGIARAEGRSLATYKWSDIEKIDRKGQRQKVRALEQDRLVPVDRDVTEFIIAGSEAVVGGDGQITAIDYGGQRNQWWKHAVDGRVLGLAAGNGRVVATTDRGIVYLFDGNPPPRSSATPAPPSATPADERTEAEAKSILAAAGVKEGYAVQFGAGNGDLALALAKQSALNILAIEPDPAKASEARQRVAAAGLYGSRITVHVAPLDATTFPKQFANLVIAPAEQVGDKVQAEMRRLRRPYSGVLCQRSAGHFAVEKSSAPVGTGSWTHQNSNAANTLCSDDEAIKGQLSMYWFRDVDFEIANRHGQGPAPLVDQGYMVVAGVNGVTCLDAYNGRQLWTYEIKDLLIDYDGIHHDVGVGDTGGPLCIGGDSVYVKDGPRCLRIDLATGKLRAEFKTPVPEDAGNRNWGYLAWENGVLYGSVENQEHNVSPRYQLTNLRTESVSFFAMDPETGAMKWQYQPKGSIRHNAVAIASNRVYLIDRPLIDADRVSNPKRDGKSAPKLTADKVPNGALLALDATTGQTIWKNDTEIWGTQLAVSAKHNTLLMNYKAVRHNFFEIPSEVGGKLAGFDAATGKRTWEQDAKYETRPLINDDKIYAQGGAWDLTTGKQLDWEFKRSYGCGQIASSRNVMLFRSGTLGYVDLSRTEGTENYGGIRPSCWISAVPANGLVLVPDGSSKCQCSYQMRAWFALQGAD